MEVELNGKSMDLDTAVALMQGGMPFGDVYPHVPPADRDQLRRVFVTDVSCGPLPKSGVRTPIPRCRPKSKMETSDQLCIQCGGLMMRTGTCLTCTMCGTSSGGCG